MMKTYARIYAGQVAELFSTDQDIATLFHPALVWVDITGMSPQPQERWLYAGGVFSPPPPPAPPPPPRPTPLQWLRRLTPDKQQAIFVAAATNPVVLGWLFEADGAGGGIDVTDPLTVQGVAAIAAAIPAITAADQAILLAP